ncbi:Rid family hydrolase [Granulosicoccaceae sp. 1_MG-2023]|nr:Rid family hydrolase [Granulosicoccaceae sp. 1_MG-2023]
MTTIVKLKTGSKFEESGSYSRLVSVGDWIYMSNTAGRNPDTKELADDLIEQTGQVFINIETALRAVDASLADVVCSRVFIQNPEDVPAVMEFIGQKFKGIDPVTTVTCPPLASTVYKVEVEVTAYRNASTLPTQQISIA